MQYAIVSEPIPGYEAEFGLADLHAAGPFERVVLSTLSMRDEAPAALEGMAVILRSGIPRLDEVDELLHSGLYRRMRTYDETFVARNGRLMRRAVFRWVSAPMHQWSRRWEYPFVASHIFHHIAGLNSGRPLQILDAGSGVTFFPYFLTDEVASVNVICCDSDRRYVGAFERLGRATGNESVAFFPGMLQELPFDAESMDIVTCISVLEHTGRYDEILSEFARVLRPGGLLLLTFDISLDGRSDIPPTAAQELVEVLGERFELDPSFSTEEELGRLEEPGALLTTDAVRQSDQELLPWKWPILKSAYDLLHGRGWSGGFFSLTFCCLSAQAKGGTTKPAGQLLNDE